MKRAAIVVFTTSLAVAVVNGPAAAESAGPAPRPTWHVHRARRSGRRG